MFETKAYKKDAEDFKTNWKEIDKSVKEKFPRLKICYIRGD